MANFAVNPQPFVPEGLVVEEWARPARGRIVVSGNPTRRHEEYAIVTVNPPPEQDALYAAMEEVVHYFEDVQGVRVESRCLSPLGLCLIQFGSAVTRDVMVSLSPFQLDDGRELVVEDHDKGLNMRSCPFTHTCWVMFLAFPLDFQVREIIEQAVGQFGTIITWTTNRRRKSRVLLRCKVTMISRIPRSLLVCESNPIGDNGSSWSVPVFVLNSRQTDHIAGDEDQIPPNGNPHPVNAQLLNEQNHPGEGGHGFFVDVGDLNEIQAENINHGWEVPVVQQPVNNNGGWGAWIEQEGDLVGDNELAAVDQLAEAVIANAVQQHPNQPQQSMSVSSEAGSFFRAEGPEITVEIPAQRANPSAHLFDSDHPLRELAARLGLHAGIGPVPSVEMLIRELAEISREALKFLPLKEPMPQTSYGDYAPSAAELEWFLNLDNPNYGNNAEASTSSGIRMRRFQRWGEEGIEVREEDACPQDNQLVVHDERAVLVLEQDTHGDINVSHLGSGPLDVPSENVIVQVDASTSCGTSRKRKAVEVADDEVRRSARLRKNCWFQHIRLDSEPRRKKGEARKSVSFLVEPIVVEPIQACPPTEGIEVDLADVEEDNHSEDAADQGEDTER